MKVRLSPPAQADLRRIKAYLSARSPAGAKRVTEAIQATIGHIRMNPLAARPGLPGTREAAVVRTPYVIIYRVTQSKAEVLRIYHGAQDRPLPDGD